MDRSQSFADVEEPFLQRSSEMEARLITVVVSLAALIAACGRGGAPPPTAVGGGPAPVASTPWSVKEQMKEHFLSTAIMRDALIRGDLGAFTTAAALISSEGATGPTWGRSDAVRDAAARARGVETTASAARSLAELAVACGDCHRARARSPIVVPAAPPAFASGNPQMARHRWAVDRLWEGLSAPSDEAWKKGSNAFSDAPLVGDVFAARDSAVQAQAFTLSVRAHALAARARTAATKEERARVFGELYATCVGCHTLARSP